MDSNQIINNLDELLTQNHTIDDIVSALDNIHIIANYDLLLQKGATNIDLGKIKDNVEPIVVFNNLNVFQNAGISVDVVGIMYGLLDQGYWISAYDVEKWITLGVDPQILADKYLQSGGNLPDTVEALAAVGARINADKLTDNLIKDEDHLLYHFHVEDDVPILQKVGLSQDAIHSVLRRVSQLSDEDDYSNEAKPYPEKSDLVLDGKQAVKIFFVPRVQIITKDGGRDIEADWAGRILPGQSLEEGIATELKSAYNYSGRFEYRDVYFSDYVQDNKGNDIQRYSLYVTLYPTESDLLQG